MTDTAISPAMRRSLTLDAIDVVELIDKGELTSGEAIEASSTISLVRGLVLYANLLETMIYLGRGSGIDEIRRAARATAESAGKRVEGAGT